MRSPDPDTIGRRQLEHRTFVQRTLVVLGLITLFAVAALLLWHAHEIFLLAFVGMLIATFLNAPAGFHARHTKVPYGLALAITIVTLLGIGVAGAWWLGPRLTEQAIELVEQLPSSVSRLLDAVAPGGAWLLERVEANVDLDSDDLDLIGGVTSTASALGTAGAKLI